MANAPQVTKVKPYPISAQMKDARGISAGQIVRLTVQGLMIEVARTSVQPGEKVEITFVTPIQNGAVALAGVVIKIYNQLTSFASGAVSAAPAAAPGTISLIEIHYASVPPDSMNRIAMFLEATGQAKRG